VRFDEVFTAVAHKRLALVDLPKVGSHQHELNGTAALRAFFGDTVQRGELTWIRFEENSDPVAETGCFTFYDARAKSSDRTGRSEWRFYYTGEPLAGSHPGDLLVVARSTNDGLFALSFEADSGWERAARLLFPIADETEQLQCVEAPALKATKLDVVRRSIMEQLGFDYVIPEQADMVDLVVRRYGLAFPPTVEMGRLARDLVRLDATNPDALLLAWMDTEEQLFRSLERLIVGERIERGFLDVDEFLSFSLSVQNRRKSRAGHAFENHLAALFEAFGVVFERQVRTEGNRTADFVFPNAAAYRNPGYPVARITVFAAKTTCKDRWPQVLADADRVAVKHLGTLDSTLSAYQLTDMLSKSVVPVIPEAIRRGYEADASYEQILNMAAFVEMVRRLGG